MQNSSHSACEDGRGLRRGGSAEVVSVGGELRNAGSPSISADHLKELAASAIDEEFAISKGVRTAYGAEELPDGFEWVARVSGDRAFPALVFRLEEPDGTVKHQIKPRAGSVKDGGGRTEICV